jgi:hypothetical protein
VRETFGFILANALLLLAGAGVLAGLGIVRLRAGEMVANAGLALATGVATVMLVEIILLVLGGPGRFLVTAALCVLISAVGFALAWRAPGAHADDRTPDTVVDDRRTLGPAPTPGDGDVDTRLDGEAAPAARTHQLGRLFGHEPDTILVRAAMVISGVIVGWFLVRSWQAYTASPVSNFDEFAIWSKKGLAFYYLDGLDPSFFANAAYNPIHLEYPILLPALEGFVYRAMGRPDAFLMHGEMLVTFVAFAWSFLALGARERRNWLWVAVLLALAVSPFVHNQQPTGLADITTACFAGLGALCIGHWLEGGERRLLVLGALLLAAASNTKLEGLMTALVAGVVVVGTLLIARERARLRTGAMAAGLFLVLVLPWRIWIAAHPAIDTFFDFRKAFNPAYLIGNVDRVPTALGALQEQVADSRTVLYLVPAGLAMTIVAIATRVDRRLALYYLCIGLGVVAGIVWIWVVTPGAWSANRVVSIPTMIAAAAIMHLGARMPIGPMPPAERDEPSERAAERRADQALQAR